MLRLTFVVGSLAYGGAERHAITLVNHLARRGHDCQAVYIKRADDQLDRLRAGRALCLGAGRYFDLGALRELAGHVRAFGPSALVAANSYALMYAWLALRAARSRAPLVVTYHSTRLLSLKERLQMLAYRPLFRTSDCLVFVSGRQRRYWLRRGVRSRRNEVIHNGVDTDAFHPRHGRWRGEMRDTLGFSASDYVIGIPAVLRPEKNHVQLVDAVSLLKKRGTRARALMIGDGEMRAAVERRARELGIEGDVVITGFQPEVRPYLAACDVVALCSLTETFSMAAIEAMAMGKPVIHADVGGAREMIFPGRNGFLFPAGDAQALAQRLAALSDPALAASMGKNARQVVETLFAEETMVERYERLFLELCATGAAAGQTVAG